MFNFCHSCQSFEPEPFHAYTFFLYKQPSSSGSNLKNGLKVKQHAKQPPTLM